MERMEINLSIMTKDQLKKFIVELDQENKKLNEINESQNEEIQRFKDNAMQDMREITELEIENRKLKEENKKLKSDLDLVYIEGKILNNDLCMLRKENEFLKEKLNKAGLEEYGFFNEY